MAVNPAYMFPGQTGENIAQLQRMLAGWAKADPRRYGAIAITGTFDAQTVAALKKWQAVNKLSQTGTWGPQSIERARSLAKYMSGGKTTNWIGTYPNTLGNDRTYVVQQYQSLFGKPPTQQELDYEVTRLQTGTSRVALTSALERKYPHEAVDKIFQEMYGRLPTAQEKTTWVGKLYGGTTTRAAMREWIGSTLEAKNYKPPATPAEGAEDSRATLNAMLDDMGLGGLKEWAWEQIQQGHSPTRVLQDMRQTDDYKTRFRGLVQRVDAGLPAMSEQDYLAYEESAEQIMRANGMPADFRTQSSYADLIAGNVSLAELSDRVQEGYVRVNTAPVEVRNKFAEWFGASGDAALASFFLSKDRSIPALRQQIAAAEVGGIGEQFDLDFSYQRASQIAEAGIDKDSARQGFAQIDQLDPLFNESVSEVEDLTAEDAGADAVFQLGGEGATALERRGRTRVAATSGGGGAAVGSGGTGAGTSD